MSRRKTLLAVLCASVALEAALACDAGHAGEHAVDVSKDGGDAATWGDAGRDGSCEPTTCSAEGKDCGAIPDGCGGSLDCGTCEAGQCGEVTPNVCGCPDPNQTFTATPKTARRARSAGFSGTVEQYAEIFGLACTAVSDCETACTARGGTAEMCQASDCLADSDGGSSCLPPPIWTNLESIQFEATSLSETVQQVVVATPYRDALLVDQFQLEVPSAATIDGIVVEVRRASTGFVSDDSVRIIKGGAVGSAERASGVWGETFEWVSYGSSTDLWGEAWTPADLNAADFGVALSVLYTNTVGNTRAYVDQVRVTVYYRVVCG